MSARLRITLLPSVSLLLPALLVGCGGSARPAGPAGVSTIRAHELSRPASLPR